MSLHPNTAQHTLSFCRSSGSPTWNNKTITHVNRRRRHRHRHRCLYSLHQSIFAPTVEVVRQAGDEVMGDQLVRYCELHEVAVSRPPVLTAALASSRWLKKEIRIQLTLYDIVTYSSITRHSHFWALPVHRFFHYHRSLPSLCLFAYS